MTYFKPKNMGDVRLLLGGIDDNVPVTLTSGVQLPSTVRTVGDLRRLTAWPTKHRLVVERGAPFLEVRVELGRAVPRVVGRHRLLQAVTRRVRSLRWRRNRGGPTAS
jgi:hypothetical protein